MNENAIEFIKSIMDRNVNMALTLLESLLQKEPNHLEALQMVGLCYFQTNHIPDAAKTFQTLTQIDPTPSNYATLASCYSKLKLHTSAVNSLKSAIELTPQDPLLWNNLSIQFHELRQMDLAFEAIHKAFEFTSHPMLWNNLGLLYAGVRDFRNAIDCYNKAIAGDPEYVAAHVNLALSYHLSGDWKQGFKEFEWRFFHYPQFEAYLSCYNPQKLWNGKDSLVGETILVDGEQGLGDIIMFSRFAKQLKDLGAYVVFNVHKSLASVIKQIDGIDEVVSCDIYNTICKLPEHDYHMSSMSAPHLLSLNEISGKQYIPAKPLNKSDSLRVGLVWAGNKNQPEDEERSIPFDVIKQIVIPEVQFFSLQMGYTDSLIGEFPNKMIGVKNFEDTQEVLRDIDLVIGCQTSIMHLCGAMGRPVWTLLAYDPDWRWGVNTESTFWYDSMRLFHQREKGNWIEVIDRVRVELEKQKAGHIVRL